MSVNWTEGWNRLSLVISLAVGLAFIHPSFDRWKELAVQSTEAHTFAAYFERNHAPVPTTDPNGNPWVVTLTEPVPPPPPGLVLDKGAYFLDTVDPMPPFKEPPHFSDWAFVYARPVLSGLGVFVGLQSLSWIIRGFSKA